MSNTAETCEGSSGIASTTRAILVAVCFQEVTCEDLADVDAEVELCEELGLSVATSSWIRRTRQSFAK